MREKRSSSSSTSPCAHLRAAYNNCFNRWYSEKFVKGQWTKEDCVSEWQKYRAYLSDHLEDKHLTRFLEAEGFGGSISQDNVGISAENATSQ
ncbi:Mitochondrial distribution/morphology family 35/apoptosis [Quillaja saponaria]|uniref:Mitochondrial distribution/morphology family 35/apoptosis n=1 Tax=Quillaja saponaria TaxID=32244 RepID=A0AAD7PJY9_QUISA|nr:Mitochondrial distribution/morphology family 35/apoptosis [Quillaja saponaria]